MKKTLITAAAIKKHFETNEKIIYVEPKSIITPAARDASSELGVEIVIGAKPAVAAAETKYNYQIKSAFDPALIAGIVKAVIAQLHVQPPLSLNKEIDPSGLCVVRGSSIILEDCPATDPKGGIKKKKIFGGKENSMSAGFVEINASSFSQEPKRDVICYVLQGALNCEINSNKYKGKEGDTFFIPAKRQVTYSSEEKAKLFFVACSL